MWSKNDDGLAQGLKLIRYDPAAAFTSSLHIITPNTTRVAAGHRYLWKQKEHPVYPEPDKLNLLYR